ncbi:3-dehydroquinate synthase [Nanoarchaeota archaeon]
MTTIKVNTKQSYNIEITDLFSYDFSKFGKKFVIITDSNVNKLYGNKLLSYLKSQNLQADILVFPAGEKSKTPDTVIKLLRNLAKRNVDKSTILIAFGGGVVGDIVGFVASIYERGINFIQVPTTLMAQVDSSIGGKTGVNLPEGKNLMGSFHQPLAVITDTKLLKTLNEKEFKNGLAEIIKSGMTQDKELFEKLENNNFNDINFIKDIIETSAKLKANIVEKDEKESELRKILNYGHTIGHAIETIFKYKITHGEGLGSGMYYEAKIANKLGLLDNDSLERQNKLITKLGLPTVQKADINKLIEIMKLDKKNKDGKIYFVLPTEIGKVKEENGKICFPVEENIIRECLK